MRKTLAFPVLLSALACLVATLGSIWLARQPSSLAHAGAALLVAAGILATAALTPTRTYSRAALLAAGAILATAMVLPLAFVHDREDWLRQTPALLGSLWIWMFFLGAPRSRTRGGCTSRRALLLATALLGGGAVAAALW